MDEIEYLEEYEDLILPGKWNWLQKSKKVYFNTKYTCTYVCAYIYVPFTKSNGSAFLAMSSHSAATKGRATSNVVSMADDEDSSSIDQDIFESLFDDHSDDESIAQRKGKLVFLLYLSFFFCDSEKLTNFFISALQVGPTQWT